MTALLMSESFPYSFVAEVSRRISSGFPRGAIFFAEDIQFDGRPEEQVRLALSELSRSPSGGIIRLCRGVYCRPRLDPSAKVIVPDDLDVAAALAARWRVRIAPCGEQAAYLAGLIDFQRYPLRFVSDGSYQYFNLQNGRRIEFIRRKSLKVFSFLNPRMRNLVEGVRFLGMENIREHEAGIIMGTLAEIPDGDFRHDIMLSPGWVREYFLTLRGR